MREKDAFWQVFVRTLVVFTAIAAAILAVALPRNWPRESIHEWYLSAALAVTAGGIIYWSRLRQRGG